MAQTQTVTILFCDLVGSTALMSRLGDDANDRVRRRLFVALREAVTASRGNEVKSAGDGIMVAFPASAADAVSCAVAMQRGVARLTAQDPLLGLAIRVGLSSGEASLEDNDWFGVPVVEAARLEHAARPGQILVADVTRTLVGTRGGHTFTRVGALDLKGLPEPLPASEVAWEPDPGLPSVPLPSGLDRGGLPFAGRADALSRLRIAWDAAMGGERELVLVSGEAGMGKTRLAAEFAAEVHSDHVVVLYGRSESDREIPYQPFAEALRWYVLAGQPPLLREQVGTTGGDLARIVPALRNRLPDLPEARSGDPASERAWLFEAVEQTIRALCERAPVLLVLDDLEAASTQTLEMLRHLISSLDPMRLLVLGLAGEAAGGSPWAEEAAAFAALPGVSQMELQGLSTDEVAALLTQAGVAGDSPDFAARVRSETEGNPRFVAELVARAAETGSPEAVFEAACPYMGLRAFEPGDAELYFGREETVGAFLGRLGANRVLSVVGASGSGKSSLVRAGMVSRLRAGALPGSADWDVVLMTPGANPLTELASRLAALAHLSAPSVLRDLEAEPRTLDLVVRQALAEKGDGARVLLVVDQFEELFTLCRDAVERQRFIDALLHAVSIPGGRTLAIIAMRADFYGESARYPGLADALEASHALLGPMEPEDMREAIERPAAAAGLRIEPGLTDRILRDVGDEPGGLPLLSHALLETWKRREGRNLTVAGYAASGGVRGAIAQTADAVYSGLGEPEQAIARNLFVRLTELGEGTEDTRRRVAFSEVAPAGAEGERVRAVITTLADARLLTTSTDSVEVAHEALIREWPRLRGWLDDDREGLRLMRHLTESAQSWERLGRDEGELYRGARLSAALEWEQRSDPDLNAVERAFLDESRELHERELREAHARARRLRILALAASGLAVVALVVGGLAALQWSRANDARDTARTSAAEADEQRGLAEAAANEAVEQRIAAEAAATDAIIARLETEIPLLMTTDRSLAFALAAQSHDLAPGPRTDAIMNVVLGDDPRYLGRIFPSEPRLSGYDLSPDGKYIALRTTGGLFELYDASTRELVTSIEAEPTGAFATISFLPDGKSVLSATLDQSTKRLTLTLRHLPDLAELERFELASVQSMAGRLQADGRQFFMTIDGVLHIFDIVDWTDRTVPGLQPLYGAPQLDPLGRYMAAALGPSTQSSNAIGLFDPTTFELVRSVPAAPSFFVFTPDGSLLVMSYGSAATNLVGRADLWNPETGELLATIPTAIDPGAIAIDSAGERAALKTATRQLGIVSLPELKPVTAPFETLSQVFSIPKFGQGDDRLYFHALTYALEHWDLSGSGLVSVYTEATGPGNVALAPDGTWFVKQSADGHWSRWRVPDFTLIDRSTVTAGDAVLTGPVDSQPGPAVSGDGKYFATAHSDCPRPSQVACGGSVVVWDAATGSQVGEPVRIAAQAVQNGMLLEFHPDLPLLAIAFQNLVTVVSLDDGLPSVAGSFTVQNPNAPYIASLDFVPLAVAPSPTLVVRASQLLSVWDVAEITGAPLGTWNHQASVRSAAVAPDGTVALLRASGDLHFVDHESLVAGTEPEPLSVVPGVVAPGQGGFLRFSTDGRNVAIRNNITGTVSVWDVETKASIGASFAAAGTTSAHMTPDGKSLLVASDQQTILWDLDTALWFEKVCFAAGRNLTEAEWTKYFPGWEYEATCEQWPEKPKS